MFVFDIKVIIPFSNDHASGTDIVTPQFVDNQKIYNSTIERLKEIVERQYGCHFDYTKIDENNTELLLTDLEKGEPVTAGDWVFFPIFDGKNLTGAGRISSREQLNHKQMMQLYQVIKLVIEGLLSNTRRIEQLHIIEDNLNQLLDKAANAFQSSKINNIIPIQKYRTNPYPLRSAYSERMNALNFSFLVESQNAEDIYKMAIEIHHFSRRFAFLKYSDISKDTFDNIESIKSMGNVTIFIDDICKLRFSEQEKILNYFHSSRDRECPKIVAGTGITLTDLKRSALLIPELLNFLMTGYIRLDSSFQNYKKADMLDFFFNHLSGRMT